MPTQVRYSKNPELSIVAYDLSRGENIFLTYTHGRENGPGIVRPGTFSPYMQHLYPKVPGEKTTHPDGLRLRTWLIREELRAKDVADVAGKLSKARSARAGSDVIGTLECYERESALITAHDREFSAVYPDLEIIGQQGNGDLSMNLWNVAYINSPLCLKKETRLLHLHEEPLAARTYTCLVKWRNEAGTPGRVSIEDLRFSPEADSPNEKVWNKSPRLGDGAAPQGDADGWANCGDRIEFATSNRQIIRQGAVVNINRLTHQFSDLRHLLQLPNLNPDRPLPEVAGDDGKPRPFFGQLTRDDIWFGESQLVADINLQRAAMAGPVVLSNTARTLEDLTAALQMGERSYSEERDSTRELQPGEFRRVPGSETLVEIYFRRNVYAWTMIGVTQDASQILCLACAGDPRRGKGYVLEEAAAELVKAGAWNALLIDEGADVFQTALLGHPGDRAKYEGSGPSVDITLPLQRTRLRSTFIFARQRTTQPPEAPDRSGGRTAKRSAGTAP